MVPSESAVEVQQRSHAVRHLVVWPGRELVVSDALKTAGTESRLQVGEGAAQPNDSAITFNI